MHRKHPFAAWFISLCLCLALIPLPALADGPVTLALAGGKITIEPDGYTQGGNPKVAYTGPYVITGSATGDTPLHIRNDTGAPASFDISLQGANILGLLHTTALRADGNAAISLKLTNLGGNSVIKGGNHPALVTDNSLDVTLSVAAGTLTLASQSAGTHAYGQGVTVQLETGTTTDQGGSTVPNNDKDVVLVEKHNYASNGDGTHTCQDAGCGKTADCISNGVYADALDGLHHTTTCSLCLGTYTQEHDAAGAATDLGDGTHRLSCAACGAAAIAPAAHDTAGDPQDLGDGTHAATCSACGAVSGAPAPHDADGGGDYNDAVHWTYCSACDAMNEAQPHSLAYDPDGYADNTHHTLSCAVCGYVVAEAHQPGATGSVQTPPTADAPGVWQETCTVCGRDFTQPIAPADRYTVHLTDSYGDGWNGAEVSVWVDGVEVQRLTMADGREATHLLSEVSPEACLAFRFHRGSYDDECGVEIYAPGQHTPVYVRNDMRGLTEGSVLFAVNLADYSGVEAALDSIPDDLSGYTLDSIRAVQQAADAVQWYLGDQAAVDGFAAAIRTAVQGLTLETESPDLPAVSLSLQDGDTLAITATGYRLNGGAETPHAGPYALSGVAEGARVEVQSGSHRITLQDLHLTNDAASPLAILPGARAYVTLQGDNLLDADAAYELAGLNVPAGATLCLYGPGRLTAKGGDDAAGIGGNYYEDAGNITIYSGAITAQSAGDGAGIGGGYGGGAGVIRIYGGDIHAECREDDGAGIGCGDDGWGGSIAIYGGTVTALSLYDDGAGIGGADEGRPDSILIAGGVITARGCDGAGIGGGDETDGGQITITGGRITASSVNGAAIGGGTDEAAGQITLSGGVIVIDGHGGNILGNDWGNRTPESDTNFVVIDGASIFSDRPAAVVPAPKDLSGRLVYPLTLTTSREDGDAAVTLADGSQYLAYVLDGRISIYVPQRNATGVVGDPDADYSAVDAALARVPKDLSAYTPESVAALQAAMEAVERGLYVDRQADVDAMAAALEAALAGLTLPATPTPQPGVTPGPSGQPTAPTASQQPGDSAGTGDDIFSRILPYVLLLALAAAAIAAVLVVQHRRRRGK